MSLSDVIMRIHQAEHAAKRPVDSVQLLAVSKKQDIQTIRAVYEQGQRLFGENFVQEALDKISALADLDIEWHFIGHVQSNKTRKIAEHFSWVHSVADFKIAERLSKQRPASLAPLNICIQVNIDEQPSKDGVLATEVEALMQQLQSLAQIQCRGLMCIPAPREVAEQQAVFHQMKLLFDRLHSKGYKIDTLSMGMSQDLAAAVFEGATIVRVGTAIFGERQ